jgi:3-methyladenine DNA glycosylase AlkD
MDELKKKGTEKTRKTYARHGMATEKMFGVSVADLKVIAKTIKGQQALACELYETGSMDAMYLAGMIADGSQLSKQQLNAWAEGAANLRMIAEYTVPWVTVENPHARELAKQWIKSSRNTLRRQVGAYSGLLATTPDAALDLAEIESLPGGVVRESRPHKTAFATP